MTNRYSGNCIGCGAFVPAGEGSYNGGVWCQAVLDTDGDAWGCAPYIARRAVEQARSRAVQASTVYVPTEAELARQAEIAARNATWLKMGLVPCKRCGGFGGSSQWPGFTCYDCGGTGCIGEEG